MPSQLGDPEARLRLAAVRGISEFWRDLHLIRSETHQMIRLSVLYPDAADSRFDIDYYRKQHMALVKARCGAALKRAEVERGLAGFPPGAPAPFRAIGHLTFDSVETMQESFVRNLPEFLADLANFTDIAPTVQISEVVT